MERRKRTYRLALKQETPEQTEVASRLASAVWGDPEWAGRILEFGSGEPSRREAARIAADLVARAKPERYPTPDELAAALLRQLSRSTEPKEPEQAPQEPPAPLDTPQPQQAPDQQPDQPGETEGKRGLLGGLKWP